MQVVPTILPSGTVWDCKRGRLLLGMEQLALQGIQFESPDILTNNQNQDLAGNAHLVSRCGRLTSSGYIILLFYYYHIDLYCYLVYMTNLPLCCGCYQWTSSMRNTNTILIIMINDFQRNNFQRNKKTRMILDIDSHTSEQSETYQLLPIDSLLTRWLLVLVILF